MEFLLITNEPEIARSAVAAGVARVFVDLEVEGKRERQSSLDAHLSDHTIADVARMRAALPEATLAVRCNRFSDASAGEVDAILAGGADMIILPMIVEIAELARFRDMVAGRARIIALIETPAALGRLRQMIGLLGPSDEVYLGLNDLSLGLGYRYLMEPLAGGVVDFFCAEARNAGLTYGFGGLGRIGARPIRPELLLSEHVRLGSTRVILSRAFRTVLDGASGPEDAGRRLAEEVGKLHAELARLRTEPPEALERNRRELVAAILAAAGREAA